MEKTISTNSHVKLPALASLLAAGIGCAVLGILTVLVEASPHFFKVHLNIYNPVGPLSGVSTFATLAYFISWISLSVSFKGKNISESKWLGLTFILIGVGFLLTFPPFYQIFTAAP